MDHTSRENPDYYAVLGVVSTATLEEIEAAFRELARRWHPDVSDDVDPAAEKFKRIVEAHEILRDPGKRRQYDRRRDRLRTRPSRRSQRYSEKTRSPAGISPASHSAGSSKDLSELVRAFFGGSAGPKTAAPEARVESRFEVELLVSPEEARHGGAVPITLTLPGRCRVCAGCGRVEKTPCDRCGGHGSIPGQRRNLVVNVPPGVWTGTRLRTLVESATESGVSKYVVFRIRVSPYA